MGSNPTLGTLDFINFVLPTDEYLDLVDANDTVIGKKKRSEIYTEGLSNFRTIYAFVVNSAGKLFIPRRAPHKRPYPLCLDASMGGHVGSGETYEVAFKRELKEELSLDADKVSYRFLAHLTPHKDNVSSFMKVYEIKMNETPSYNQNDFVEYFWLTPKELLARMKKGERAKEDLPKLVPIFYGDK